MKNRIHPVVMLALLCCSSMPVSAQNSTDISEEEVAHILSTPKWTRAGVHDPSIVVTGTGASKTYYVFGSHMGAAKTKDLRNWSNLWREDDTNCSLWCNANGQICSFNNAFVTNKVTSVKNHQGIMTNWGTFNIPAYQGGIDNFSIKGNMWAPDVIYNPTMKKWCHYLSLNGSKWNSAIILLTSDNVEGPYQYQGPVVFSGFNVTSNAATDWTKTDMKIATGYTSLPDRYKVGDKWGTYWPHAIDPGVFYDDKGELWMNYGSWSGGIYILKLDKTTGLRDYTYKYESDYDRRGASVGSDPYFGKKIAGGYYVSGEGSYIEKIGDYYYLFMSYGFYSPEGGYEMRVFRSQNPDGPYTDHTGESATYTKYLMNYGTKATTTRGMKLMGGYQWPGMGMAELAQGHNSALQDEDGRAFVVYHTKFNNGTAWHELRVHQLFVNQNGWITAAPMEFNTDNDKATATGPAHTTYFEDSEMVGTYQFVMHKYPMDYANLEYVKPTTITLNADGSITGAYSGTWHTQQGTGYISMTMNSNEFNGVVVPGTLDHTNLPIVAITAMNTKYGVNIWAYKQSNKVAKAIEAKGADIAKGVVAYYNFDNNLINQYAKEEVGTASAQSSGTKPNFEADGNRGTVLHQYFGYNDANSISYTTLRNPLKGQSLNGATISAWVKRLDSDMWDALWGFASGTFDNIGSRLYLTGNAYMGYNDGNGTWYDYNHPDAAKTDIIPSNEWALVTVAYTTTGFSLFVNGQKVGDQNTYKAWNASGNINHAAVLNHISSSDHLYLGYGSFWGSTPAMFDDLLVWNRALSDYDVMRLYLAEINKESFLPEDLQKEETGVQNITSETAKKLLLWPAVASDHITLQYHAEKNGKETIELYDQSGRKMCETDWHVTNGANEISLSLHLTPGIYIVKVGTQTEKIIVR